MKPENHTQTIVIAIAFVVLTLGMYVTNYSLWAVVPSVVYAICMATLFGLVSAAFIFASAVDDTGGVYVCKTSRINLIMFSVGVIIQSLFLYVLWGYGATFTEVIVVLYVTVWVPTLYFVIRRHIRAFRMKSQEK